MIKTASVKRFGVGRLLCPLVAATMGSALAVLAMGFVSANPVHAQIGGAAYEGGIIDESLNSVGTIRVTVSENAAAVTSVEFIGFASTCLGDLNRPMELDVPPVLYEGVSLGAGEWNDGANGYSSMSVSGTFVSESELRGHVSVSSYSQTFEEPPPISPPGAPNPPIKVQHSCEKQFSFTALRVTTQAVTDYPGPVTLPDAGGGVPEDGSMMATLWPRLAAGFALLGVAIVGLGIARRRIA